MQRQRWQLRLASYSQTGAVRQGAASESEHVGTADSGRFGSPPHEKSTTSIAESRRRSMGRMRHPHARGVPVAGNLHPGET
jgi:hypothetical protein